MREALTPLAPQEQEPIRIAKERIEPNAVRDLLPENYRHEYISQLTSIRNNECVQNLKEGDGYWTELSHYKQEGSGDCLLTCLRMIMATHNGLRLNSTSMREKVANAIERRHIGSRSSSEGDVKRRAQLARSGVRPLSSGEACHFLTINNIVVRLGSATNTEFLLKHLSIGGVTSVNISMAELSPFVGADFRKIFKELRGGHQIIIAGYRKNSDGSISFLIHDPLENNPYYLPDKNLALLFVGDILGRSSTLNVNNPKKFRIVNRGEKPPAFERPSETRSMVRLIKSDTDNILRLPGLDEKRRAEIRRRIVLIEKEEEKPAFDIKILRDFIEFLKNIFKEYA